MHIPSGDTARLTILPFREALEAALLPAPDYDTDRWLYVPNTYGEYRYLLGTRGRRPLICVGVNPSTAAPGALDNTLKSVERIALHSGFDSFLMFNVYAQRATRPEDMERRRNEALHRENLAAFDYLLSLSAEPVVWAAWGNVIQVRDYLIPCVRDLIALGEKHGARWVTAGARSRRGHPHHPLYLKKDSPLDPFDAAAYCAALGGGDRPKEEAYAL